MNVLHSFGVHLLFKGFNVLDRIQRDATQCQDTRGVLFLQGLELWLHGGFLCLGEALLGTEAFAGGWHGAWFVVW